MLEIQSRNGYANVLDGIIIVGKIYYLPTGGVLVKVSDGHDTTAANTQEALEIIRKRVV